MNYVDSISLFGVNAKEIPCIKGCGEPTTATVGAVGCLYMDTDNGNLYKCTAVTEEGDIWVELGVTAAATDEKYFDIDYDGIVSLKPVYRGVGKSEFTYSESDNGYGTAGSLNEELPEMIVIPDIIEGTAVTGFQPGIFCGNNRVKEITIPDVVTQLPERFGSDAENLKAIHNTERVTKIGGWIVSNTQVEKALFPNLQEIAPGAFAGAKYLYVVDIGNNITEIPLREFYNCARLSQVKGGGSVKTIAERGFYNTSNLKNLSFLPQVTSIGNLAFYKSRIQFDWSSLDGKCTFAANATPVMDNTTDYWTDVECTPCENRIVTAMTQQDPEWKDNTFGDSGITYYECCSVFTVLHIHSGFTGKLYTHPDEFADELRIIDPQLVTEAKHPAQFVNVAPMFNALGYKTTVYTGAINQASYKAMVDALARGAYIYSQVSTADGVDSGHAVAIYGINSIGEALCVDSGALYNNPVLLRMPYQNLTGPNSSFIIVEKEG